MAAFQTLVDRIDGGAWAGSADPGTLNDQVSALGPSLNVLSIEGKLVPTAPAFLNFEPTPFLRPFDLGSP